jgi:hypothetical protein
VSIAAWLFWLWTRPQPQATSREPIDPIAASESPAPAARSSRPARVATPSTASTPADETCTPAAEERCYEGDVWLLDGCGQPEEKLDECAERACRDATCDEPYEGRCSEPAEGRCEGDTVKLCLAGRPLAIDCRARGLRCGQGAEGAECKPEVPRSEQCRGPTHCEGETLLACRDGRREVTDCQAVGARCLLLPGARLPRCVDVKPLPALEPGCGPCGCPREGSPQERACDGLDDDGDGLLDEGLDCGPVPVIAFVIRDASGQTSHAREDIELSLREASLAFVRSDGQSGLTLALEEVVPLDAPALTTLDEREFSQLVDDPRLQRAREGFYVPVVFTEQVLAGGDVPKPGISTLPNGTCGGMQQSYGPELGLVAVAKARYPTTLAHEIGHFLGLCHTHDQQEALAPPRAFRDGDGAALESCLPSCRGEGDGICDTPFDPGPESCSYDESCRPSCSAVAAPETENLMGYYAYCRQRFSDEQLALMQHTVALRRAWQRCLFGACRCTLAGAECPVGMSCKHAREGGQELTLCALDGPRAPGAECRAPADCGQHSTCMTNEATRVSRCVRPCLASDRGCECTKVAADLSVCLQDLEPRR